MVTATSLHNLSTQPPAFYSHQPDSTFCINPSDLILRPNNNNGYTSSGLQNGGSLSSEQLPQQYTGTNFGSSAMPGNPNSLFQDFAVYSTNHNDAVNSQRPLSESTNKNTKNNNNTSLHPQSIKTSKPVSAFNKTPYLFSTNTPKASLPNGFPATFSNNDFSNARTEPIKPLNEYTAMVDSFGAALGKGNTGDIFGDEEGCERVFLSPSDIHHHNQHYSHAQTNPETVEFVEEPEVFDDEEDDDNSYMFPSDDEDEQQENGDDDLYVAQRNLLASTRKELEPELGMDLHSDFIDNGIYNAFEFPDDMGLINDIETVFEKKVLDDSKKSSEQKVSSESAPSPIPQPSTPPAGAYSGSLFSSNTQTRISEQDENKDNFHGLLSPPRSVKPRQVKRSTRNSTSLLKPKSTNIGFKSINSTFTPSIHKRNPSQTLGASSKTEADKLERAVEQQINNELIKQQQQQQQQEEQDQEDSFSELSSLTSSPATSPLPHNDPAYTPYSHYTSNRNSGSVNKNTNTANNRNNSSSTSHKPYKRRAGTSSQHGPHRCILTNPTSGRLCDKVFSRSYDLVRHQDTIHAAVRKAYICPVCGPEAKTFSRTDALSRHIRVKHPDYSN